MIIRRKRNINPENAEVTMPLSYTSGDVKQFFIETVRMFSYQVADVARNRETFSEGDLRTLFEGDAWIFANYEQKWRTQLSAWLLTQCVKLGYLTQSTIDPTKFYFGDNAAKIVQPYVEEQEQWERGNEEWLRENGYKE